MGADWLDEWLRKKNWLQTNFTHWLQDFSCFSCLKLHMRFHKLVHFIHLHMLGDFNASLLARLHLPLLPHNNDCQLARWSLFNAQIETKRLIGTLSWNTYAWLTSKRTCIFYWQAAIEAYTPLPPLPLNAGVSELAPLPDFGKSAHGTFTHAMLFMLLMLFWFVFSSQPTELP